MLSEISQTEGQLLHDFTYLWNLKKQTHIPTEENRDRLIDIEKLVVLKGRGVGKWTK